MSASGVPRVVFLLAVIHCSVQFNLEPRIPVIKRGAPDSYFGYSVAEHQTIIADDDKVETQEWLLVGAPLDQNRQPQTNRSGALWRCPLSNRLDDCDQVITDGKRDGDGIYVKNVYSHELMPPAPDEIKDGQWLGVTVRSQGPGKKVMVCAHRYVLKGTGQSDFRWGLGLCYTLNQTLGYDYIWEPCKGRPVTKAHEQYGFCQAGTSGMLLPDDTMLIGAPGPYTWRGTMYVIDTTDDYLTRDQTQYYGPVENKTSPVDKYSYLGMSVTAGQFLSDETSYAAGAPRSNGTGQVVIFSKVGPNESIMLKRMVLNGEQFASSFGYEMTTADVNGDGRSDLIVAAPFYFSPGVGGAVYVYVNSREYCLNCTAPIKLTGQSESRFGFALSSLGDLNKDGYDDIAVGSPYEEQGVVSIYLGSQQGLINVPAQTIRATELPLRPGSPLSTFGSSLSGGMDLDGNGYPDLLVGAYESAAVVLLRARPIIGISTRVQPERHLRNIDPSKRGCTRDPNSPYTCFSFEACCTITSRGSSLGELTVLYEMEAETFERKFSRVWFGRDEEGKRPSVVSKELTLRRGESHHCQHETVYLKDNTRDIQSAISFRLSYALKQLQPRLPTRSSAPLPDINAFPILDQQEAARTFHATFHTDCGDDDVCESDMEVTAELQLPPSSTPHTWRLMLGKQQEVVLNVTVDNAGESAYEAQLFISYPPSLSYIAHIAQVKQVICSPFNKTLTICSLGNPFKRGLAAEVSLRFDPRGISNSENRLEVSVFANTTSQQRVSRHSTVLRADVVRRAELSLRGAVTPEHVFYGGEPRGESAMLLASDAGTRVTHAYHVLNEGPWRADRVDLHVEWPAQVANNKPQGKWLLYLDEMPTVDSVGGGECHLAPGLVNPLGLLGGDEALRPPGPPALNSTLLRRRRRDTEVVVRAQQVVGKEGRREEVVNMDCLLGTAKCYRFHCTVHNLAARHEAVINIRARLWNSTLVSDYPRVDVVKVVSRARLHLPPSVNIEQNTSDDKFHLETVAYPDLAGQQEPEPVPMWIIVVAVVAGLLLLVLLTLILWKLGFFKRRRLDPTLSGNLEKPHRDED